MILKVKIGEEIKKGDSILYPSGNNEWAVGTVREIQNDFFVVSKDIIIHKEFALKLA